MYKRLKDIIADPGRCWYVFVNEHRKETWIERQAGETSNDRNDRAIRVATTWYGLLRVVTVDTEMRMIAAGTPHS